MERAYVYRKWDAVMTAISKGFLDEIRRLVVQAIKDNGGKVSLGD